MRLRQVGIESAKTYEKKHANGFFDTFMRGVGLDIGFRGGQINSESILETAIGVDHDYPGYDGVHLPFADESQNYVYTSHCLEHISDTRAPLREWFRVVKVGGHLIIVVPHQFLYEKKMFLPSNWNHDHKTFYTPAKLLAAVELALTPNSYRVRLCEDGDYKFDYGLGPEVHSAGQFEITLVLQKIVLPKWELK
jgi:SAM-dependent methyltransferase